MGASRTQETHKTDSKRGNKSNVKEKIFDLSKLDVSFYFYDACKHCLLIN